MKKTMVAIAVMAGLMSVSSAQAFEVVLHLDSWQAVAGSGTYNTTSTPASFNTVSGFGTFSVVNNGGSESPIFNMDKLIAMCLEPDETIGIGKTYTFDLVDLAYAPTSDTTGGDVGMGVQNSFLLSDFAEQVGFVYDTTTNQLVTAVNDMSAEERGALAMLQWEVQDDAMNLADGDMVFDINNTGYAMAQDFIGSWDDTKYLREGESWYGYGLNNVALGDITNPGPSLTNIFSGQDFSFFDYQDDREITIPEPVSLALMSLGLVGLGFTRRNARKS